MRTALPKQSRLDPYTVGVLRKLVAEADAAAEGDNNDGGSAA
jgi:hypothetical protein